MVWVLRTAKQRAGGDWVRDHDEVALDPPVKGLEGVTPGKVLKFAFNESPAFYGTMSVKMLDSVGAKNSEARKLVLATSCLPWHSRGTRVYSLGDASACNCN